MPALLRGITSYHHGGFYCLNCFHLYRTHNKLKTHKKACNSHDYCRVDMTKEHEKINTYRRKVIKSSVYNLDGFIMSTKKVRPCQNNPKNSYTEKKFRQKSSGYTWSSICSFDDAKNRRFFYKFVLKSFVRSSEQK